MRALVTGEVGFIGSHTVDRLLEEGYEVRVLDNLDPKVYPKGRPGYIAKEVEFVEGDVRNKEDIKRALWGVDVVVHQAAYQN